MIARHHFADIFCRAAAAIMTTSASPDFDYPPLIMAYQIY